MKTIAVAVLVVVALATFVAVVIERATDRALVHTLSLKSR